MTQHTPTRPIPHALAALALQRLTRFSRHEDYLRLDTLAVMLTRPWRDLGYRPVPRDHDHDGLPVAEEFVILAHASGGDDYVAFRAAGPYYRGDYSHVPISQQGAALQVDADHAWARGVHGTLAEVLAWASGHTDHLDGIEATLSLHDPRVCAINDATYTEALRTVQHATRVEVRSRLRDVAERTESRGFVPQDSGLPADAMTTAALAHLVRWWAAIPVEQFHPGSGGEWEDRAYDEAVTFLRRTFPQWMFGAA